LTPRKTLSAADGLVHMNLKQTIYIFLSIFILDKPLYIRQTINIFLSKSLPAADHEFNYAIHAMRSTNQYWWLVRKKAKKSSEKLKIGKKGLSARQIESCAFWVMCVLGIYKVSTGGGV
jgi:hypothetical protein